MTEVLIRLIGLPRAGQHLWTLTIPDEDRTSRTTPSRVDVAVFAASIATALAALLWGASGSAWPLGALPALVHDAQQLRPVLAVPVLGDDQLRVRHGHLRLAHQRVAVDTITRGAVYRDALGRVQCLTVGDSTGATVALSPDLVPQWGASSCAPLLPTSFRDSLRW